MDDRIERYRILSWSFGRPTLAIDEADGSRVVLPEHRGKPHCEFPGQCALRTSARAMADRHDSRFAPILSLSPVVVRCPDAWNDDGTRDRTALDAVGLSVREAVDVTIELLELGALAAQSDARVEWRDAWIERDATGLAHARVVAPRATGSPAPRELLHLLGLLADLLGRPNPGVGLRSPRATRDVPPKELLDALTRVTPSVRYDVDDRIETYPADLETALATLAPFGSGGARIDAVRAALHGPTPPAFDEALALSLGEEELRRKLAETPPDQWVLRSVRFELAGVHHRAACLAFAQGDVDRAVDHAATALEIDPHPEHATTLAIALDRLGRTAEARAAHDRAIDTITMVRPHDEVHVWGEFQRRHGEPLGGLDFRESFPSKCARTYEARGAFRAARGDVAGAIEDLHASLAAQITESAQRRLARLKP